MTRARRYVARARRRSQKAPHGRPGVRAAALRVRALLQELSEISVLFPELDASDRFRKRRKS